MFQLDSTTARMRMKFHCISCLNMYSVYGNNVILSYLILNAFDPNTFAFDSGTVHLHLIQVLSICI